MPADTILVSSDSEGWTGEATHEDAEDEAKSLYDDPEGTWAEVTVYRIPAGRLVDGWSGSHRASILRDQESASELDEYEVSSWSGHVDEAEPDCRQSPYHDPHPNGHDWTATRAVEGGLEENPGVFGNGGGVVIHTHCTRCPATRTEDTWATDPSDGSQGHTVVTYGRRDD